MDKGKIPMLGVEVFTRQWFVLGGSTPKPRVGVPPPHPPVPMLRVTGSGSTQSAHLSETSYSKPKTSREMILIDTVC